jgi:hypothetical protein
MSNQYLVNLSNSLIGSNRYDEKARSYLDRRPQFRKQLAVDLSICEVSEMKPAKLGEIMAAFDVGDVMATKEEIFELVHFAGDCEEMLREIVSVCLAFYIDSRLNDKHPSIPPYRRLPKRTAV